MKIKTGNRKSDKPVDLTADMLYKLAIDLGASHRTAALLLEAVAKAEDDLRNGLSDPLLTNPPESV